MNINAQLLRIYPKEVECLRNFDDESLGKMNVVPARPSILTMSRKPHKLHVARANFSDVLFKSLISYCFHLFHSLLESGWKYWRLAFTCVAPNAIFLMATFFCPKWRGFWRSEKYLAWAWRSNLSKVQWHPVWLQLLLLDCLRWLQICM